MIKIKIVEADHHLRVSVSGRKLFFKLCGTVVLIFGLFLFGAATETNWGLIASEAGSSVVGFVVCSICDLVLLYMMAALWMNRMILDINKDEVSVHRGPLYFPGVSRRSFSSSDVKQFFVQEIRNVGSDGWIPSYEVRMVNRNGEVVTLLDLAETAGLRYGVSNKSVATHLQAQARLIEENIERFLDIEDVPVENHIVERLQPDPPTSGGV